VTDAKKTAEQEESSGLPGERCLIIVDFTVTNTTDHAVGLRLSDIVLLNENWFEYESHEDTFRYVEPQKKIFGERVGGIFATQLGPGTTREGQIVYHVSTLPGFRQLSYPALSIGDSAGSKKAYVELNLS
jgi:hypothetical protein